MWQQSPEGPGSLVEGLVSGLGVIEVILGLHWADGKENGNY